jgi:kynurenine formamidase
MQITQYQSSELKNGKPTTGQIAASSFVALRTDWSKRWPDGAAMQNKDAKGVAHYPGWSLPALKYLYEERKITASGHETTDTDPGIATTKDDYSLETYILSHDHYQIELLTNLDQLPESGAIIIATFPKAKGVVLVFLLGFLRSRLTDSWRSSTVDLNEPSH